MRWNGRGEVVCPLRGQSLESRLAAQRSVQQALQGRLFRTAHRLNGCFCSRSGHRRHGRQLRRHQSGNGMVGPDKQGINVARPKDRQRDAGHRNEQPAVEQGVAPDKGPAFPRILCR